jgi:hypothetical protein
MRIRFVLPLVINKTEQFVAYFLWDRDLDMSEYLEILWQREPITFMPIGDEKIAFQLVDADTIYQDLLENTIDIHVTLASKDGDPGYLTNKELLERIREDDRWTVE